MLRRRRAPSRRTASGTRPAPGSGWPTSRSAPTRSVLRWADIETIHQLRIAAKWLRYTLEFFREALGPEVDQLIPRVVALQDHLGWLHDADVTIALTRQFLVANAGSLSREETQAIATYLAPQERELDPPAPDDRPRPGAASSGTAFRRLLGRAVSTL